MDTRALFSRPSWKDPLSGPLKVQTEMNRLFDTLLGRPGSQARLNGGTWAPPLDVYDAGDALVVHAELPGVRQEEIHIGIHNKLLTIRGERRSDGQVKGKDYQRRERVTGPFHRVVSLPSVVDTARVKAVYRKGILEIHLPKKEEARPRTIRVEAA